jgi:hypothetical protein
MCPADAIEPSGLEFLAENCKIGVDQVHLQAPTDASCPGLHRYASAVHTPWRSESGYVQVAKHWRVQEKRPGRARLVLSAAVASLACHERQALHICSHHDRVNTYTELSSVYWRRCSFVDRAHLPIAAVKGSPSVEQGPLHSSQWHGSSTKSSKAIPMSSAAVLTSP